MGSLNLNLVREELTSEERTYLLLDQVIEEKLGEFALADVVDAVQELVEIDKVGSGEVSGSLASCILLFNTEAIFKYAESPIEKIFLNALNIHTFPFRRVLIQFIHHRLDIGDIDPKSSRPQEEVVDFWRRYQKLSYKNTINSFLDMMVEVADISERQRTKALIDLLNYYIAKLYGLYYVVLQPTIKDVLVNGKPIRVDIYICSPDNENLKLVVECDGYGYHSNKSSFTQDRTRDRLLHMKGYKVLRFSGSDIVNNPTGMAEELCKYLIEQKSAI